MRDAVGVSGCSVSDHAGERSDAHGEVVWSWHPGADAKLALQVRRARWRRGQESRSPGRSRISRNAIARGRPDDRPVPVVPAACIFFAGGPWVRPAPGLSRALIFERAMRRATLGRRCGREDEMPCRQIQMSSRASCDDATASAQRRPGTHNPRRSCEARWSCQLWRKFAPVVMDPGVRRDDTECEDAPMAIKGTQERSALNLPFRSRNTSKRLTSRPIPQKTD